MRLAVKRRRTVGLLLGLVRIAVSLLAFTATLATARPAAADWVCATYQVWLFDPDSGTYYPADDYYCWYEPDPPST